MTTLARQARDLVIGVDVGGTKIAAGVVDVRGNVLRSIQLPTDTSSVEHTLQTIAHAIHTLLGEAGGEAARICGIGLGIPGKVDARRGIGLLSTNLKWRNVPVKDWLETRLGLPCTIENDVGAATLGESVYGVARGVQNMLYLSLGTGIAAGVIIQGQLYRGEHGLVGEIGHTAVWPGDQLCACGGRGCLEAQAAGPALARRASQALQAGRASCLRDMLTREEPLTTEEVFLAASQGDELALEVVNQAGRQLAFALYVLAMAYDPRLIVLGGGLALQDGPLTASIRAELTRWLERSPIFREIYAPDQLRLTGLRRNAGILGAAALVARQPVEDTP